LIEKAVLERMYLENHLSMSEIAKKLGVSVHKVVWWMDKYHIPRRSWSEATYVKRNPNGDPFKIKDKLTSKELELKGLGLGVFWGEGSKNNRNGIIIANSDYRLIKKFIEFLEKICGVKRDKLYFTLTTFNDANPEDSLKFWSSKLKVNLNRFGKPVIIPPQGKGTYKKKSKYGVLTVGCYNTKLRRWLDGQLCFHS